MGCQTVSGSREKIRTQIGGAETRLPKAARVGEVTKKRDLARLACSLVHPISARPFFNFNEGLLLRMCKARQEFCLDRIQQTSRTCCNGYESSYGNMATTKEGTTTNPRGIPTFPFMTNVSEYVKSIEEVEPTLQRFQEMVSKYTFMQQNVERRAGGLREKLPEMKDTLDTVRFLKKKRTAALESKENGEGDELDDDSEENKHNSREMEATFSLQDTLYAKATIRPAEVDEVYLWLGANVMVAYPLDEADDMLQGKLDKARDSLKAAEEDLEFLRVQITTLEVAIARVHNWDVGEKRRLRAAGLLKDEDKSKS